MSVKREWSVRGELEAEFSKLLREWMSRVGVRDRNSLR